MKLLLDTHIWLWTLLDPRRISRRVAAALNNSETEKWLSPISIWEYQVLAAKGRPHQGHLDLQGADPAAWVARALEEFPVKEAPLTNDVILAIPAIQLPHRDPADAFLVATAKVFDLTLVTADARLFALKEISVLANR
jgi:PIN domain nuclease of toxin-antitoxin system